MNDAEIQYWDKYYSRTQYSIYQSSFAEFALKYMNHGKKVADLGCGNGRDSMYFARNSLDVTGIDSSKQAITELSRIAQAQGILLTAVEGDFVKYINGKNFDYIYSRFTLHAISEEDENLLLENVCLSLESNGYFFIEARSTKDDIYGAGEYVERNAYIYNGHYRRFIDYSEIRNKLSSEGFEIIHSSESRGVAVYGSEDPVCIRIVSKKASH